MSQQVQALDEHSIVAITDTAGRIVYANDRFCEISQYSREELLGQNHRLIKSGYHPPAFWQEMYRAIARGEVWRGEVKNRAKDGSFYWVHAVVVPIQDTDGKPYRYVAIRTDITERKRAEEQVRSMHASLQAAHQELIRKNEEVQAFYHTVSHELKSPLTAIREFVSIVLDGLAGPLSETQREYLAIARESCNQLRVCIDDLLDNTRIETGKLGLEFKPGSLAALAQRVATTFWPMAAGKGIQLGCEVQPGLSEVPFDEHRVSQVISNLVSNALKFTGEGGRIVISVTESSRHPEFLEVSVADTGAGIASDQLERVFDRFYQVHKSEAAPGQGFGLGLYICRELVNLHGGKIWAESVPGQGSNFSFILPKHAQARRSGLLVVDDDPNMRDVLREILEQAEFNVTTAESGNEALRLIARRMPDLVLLDLAMPGLDGAETLRQIRQRWGAVPVVLHTGCPQGDLFERASALGAAGVLSKPWLPRQLVETLRDVREKRRCTGNKAGLTRLAAERAGPERGRATRASDEGAPLSNQPERAGGVSPAESDR